jgi:hypothetical protein
LRPALLFFFVFPDPDFREFDFPERDLFALSLFDLNFRKRFAALSELLLRAGAFSLD